MVTEDERVNQDAGKVISGKKVDRSVQHFSQLIPSTEKGSRVGIHKTLLHVQDYSPRRRRKRSPMIFLTRSAKAGYEAVQYLLNGATKIPSQEICCRDFHKKGSYFLAKADFYKVMPTDVNKFQLPNGVTAVSGEVGDRTLFLRSAGKYTDNPVLEIINREIFANPFDWSWDDPPILRITYRR